MKKSFIIGALCAALLLCGALLFFVAFANHAPFALPVFAQTKSGYDLLLEARALMKDGPNGSPSATEILAPAENLRRQRLAVARNAPALAKLRVALKANIKVPVPQSPNDFAGIFPVFASAREFARQLAQEAAVRAADGNAMGAVQSNLDALELGAQMNHGTLVSGMVGIAVSAIGRAHLEKYAPLLDASQSREVARQMDEIGGKMQTMTQMLQAEQAYGLRLTRQIFADMDDPQKHAQMQEDINGGAAKYNQAMNAMLKLPLAQVETEYQAQFARAIELADKPYFAATQAAPLNSDIAYVNLTLGVIAAPSIRFMLERNTVSNRLLADSLRLHAVKLETGVYPETFDAETDPLSPTLAPLIYKHVGDSYVLYSVGPDGVDNNGAQIQTLFTDSETGAKTVSKYLMFDSTGDIMAPIL